MRYEAYLSAFDVFDQIHITFRVWTSGDTEQERRVYDLQRTLTVAGTGRTDPAAWLLDALVAAAETL